MNINLLRYKRTLLCSLAAALFLSAFVPGTIKNDLVTNARVQQALDEKWVDIRTKLGLQKIDTGSFEVYLRAFKLEEYVEVWARNKGQIAYKPIANYPFCSNVGQLGPKRQQGDRQIPEGFYHLAEFNPESDHLLSIKVSYPNIADSILGVTKNLGGEIYIHGGCETIGCIPITDDKIKELYVLAMKASRAGQSEIPIHIFPARLNYANYRMLADKPEYQSHMRFWGSLRTAYLYFEEFGVFPKHSVNDAGEYLFYKHNEN